MPIIVRAALSRAHRARVPGGREMCAVALKRPAPRRRSRASDRDQRRPFGLGVLIVVDEVVVDGLEVVVVAVVVLVLVVPPASPVATADRMDGSWA